MGVFSNSLRSVWFGRRRPAGERDRRLLESTRVWWRGEGRRRPEKARRPKRSISAYVANPRAGYVCDLGFRRPEARQMCDNIRDGGTSYSCAPLLRRWGKYVLSARLVRSGRPGTSGKIPGSQKPRLARSRGRVCAVLHASLILLE